MVAEPLERGFGLTLGNSLRRVLLSSLQGAAMTSIQIEGVLHEFSSIAGVLEDVTDIVLNVKSIGLRMHGDGPKRMRLRATGPGEVRAGAIETGHDIEVLNPEQVICTLDNGARISMELTVEIGKGYVPATANRPEDAPIGLIPVDALFSPVRKVSYRVENTRVGQVTDYDRLSMRVETNGAVSPEDAVALAARILQDQLKLFSINFEEPTRRREEREATSEPLINKNLLRKVDELELSVRSANWPQVPQHRLYRRPRAEDRGRDAAARRISRAKIRLNEIKEVLANMGLHLGMEIQKWPPENIEDLAKRIDEQHWWTTHLSFCRHSRACGNQGERRVVALDPPPSPGRRKVVSDLESDCRKRIERCATACMDAASKPPLRTPQGDVREPLRFVAQARADQDDAAQGQGSAPDRREADHHGPARRVACPPPSDRDAAG